MVPKFGSCIGSETSATRLTDTELDHLNQRVAGGDEAHPRSKLAKMRGSDLGRGDEAHAAAAGAPKSRAVPPDASTTEAATRLTH